MRRAGKLVRDSTRKSFSSVSEKEVSKFSGLKKTWWDPRQNPLIGMNPIRVQYITNNTTCALSGLKILDVGSGGGILSESLARLGGNVTALEPSYTLVEHAQKHAGLDPKTRNIKYKGGCSIEQLASNEKIREESEACLYDVICILEVLEHVENIDSILSAARSLLKPNTGRLFVSTLNRTIKSQMMAIIGAEYIMRYLPPGTHDWNQFRSPNEVELLMNRVGMQQVDVQGLVVTKPPLWGQWDWKLDRKDTDVNWIGTYKIII